MFSILYCPGPQLFVAPPTRRIHLDLFERKCRMALESIRNRYRLAMQHAACAESTLSKRLSAQFGSISDIGSD